MEELLQFWGKASATPFGDLKWAPLVFHMEDSAAVARHLTELWMPPHTIDSVAKRSFLKGTELETLIPFLAAIHDLGKATPAFQAKPLRENRSLHLKARLQLATIHPELNHVSPNDSRSLPHNYSSHILFRNWLTQKHQWSRQNADRLALILSGHHGIFPEQSDIVTANNSPHLGDDKWRQKQSQIIELFASDPAINSLLSKEFKIDPSTALLVNSLIIMSDWIASSEDLFSLTLDGAPLPNFRDSQKSAEDALDRLQLPLPWEPSSHEKDINLHLRKSFRFPNHIVANKTQQTLYELTKHATAPEIYILESPTGVGKTEAALLAAENLVTKFGLAGITIALPTQATTDAMYMRVHGWITNRSKTTQADIQLAHGKARFNEHFEHVPYSDEQTDIHDELETTTSKTTKNRWYSQSKKKLLANFTVATIDQILAAGLKTRHNALRHLGLARKVLIIDELHAADIYMRQYLYRVLEWAGAYGVPVICLSATLPTSVRDGVLHAYQSSQEVSAKELTPLQGLLAGTSSPQKVETSPKFVAPYPRISVGGLTKSTSYPIENDIPPRTIHLKRLELSGGILVDFLQNELVDGGRVLIIRNTVKKAIETYQLLSAEFPGQTMLTHSRFTTSHRNHNDSELLNWFGKDTVDPPGTIKIVISTQVAEQSLDIDADLLITDIAPTDILLQRIGRLHRHSTRVRSAAFRRPQCIVLGVDIDGETIEIDDSSSRIYSEALLLNTAVTLWPQATRLSQITVPTDVDRIIRQTYDNPPVPPNDHVKQQMSEAQSRFHNKEDQLARRAKIVAIPSTTEERGLWGFSTTPHDTSSEEKIVAQVRDIEESIEAILIYREDATYRTTGESDAGLGMGLDLDYVPEPRAMDQLVRSTIRVPGYVIGSNALNAFPGQLEDFYVQEWQAHPDLKNQLFLVLDRNAPTTLGNYKLTYSQQFGLEISKDEV